MRATDTKQVGESFDLQRRARLAKRLVTAACGVALVVVVVGLSGCAKGVPAPDGVTPVPVPPFVPFQQDQNFSDTVIENFCRDRAQEDAVWVVKELLDLGIQPSEITQDVVDAAVAGSYSDCMFTFGRGA